MPMSMSMSMSMFMFMSMSMSICIVCECMRVCNLAQTELGALWRGHASAHMMCYACFGSTIHHLEFLT